MPMTEEVARAFTVRRMTDAQVSLLWEAESKLPLPTMHLSASQIAKQYEVDRRIDLAPEEIEAMQRCWAEFYTTVLGPQQAWEETLHPTDCSMFSCRHPWDERCKTKYQEMWQWDTYALAHYRAPQVAGRGLTQILATAFVMLGGALQKGA